MNVAFIPVRGGSKSIPLKNIKPINGKPLVYWTIKAACECEYIDKIFVSTDSQKIKDVVNAFNMEKVKVIGRSEKTASDTASTESAMLEFAEQFMFDNIVLIQATSPLLTAEDLTGGFELYFIEGTDSVLSVVPQKRFNWSKDEKGFFTPLNYDYYNRPRRQEFDGYCTENGAFYITSRERLLLYKNRISGNIRAYEMSEDTFFEIDEPSDWIIIEQLLRKQKKNEKIQQDDNKKNIKMFLTDCDGCLTDGGMYYAESGEELKKFNTKDGMGISLLKDKGIITGIITGEKTDIVKRRAEKLSIDEVHQGIKNKLEIVKQLSDKYGIPMEEIAYVGDDINDLEVLKSVGLSCTVNNAQNIIKEQVDYVSPYNGGDGAVRDIAEKIMQEYLR